MKQISVWVILLFASTLFCAAQEQPKLLIYSGERKLETGKSVFDIYNHRGEKIINEPVDWAYCNYWNWIIVRNKKTNLLAIYDTTGKLFLDSLEDTKVVYTNQNRIGLKKNGKWGFYNKEGKMLIAHQFDEVSTFWKNIVAVKQKNETYFIDTSGTRLDKRYDASDEYYRFSDDYSAVGMFQFNSPNYKMVIDGKKKGLADAKGNIVLPIEYDEVLSLKEKFGLVTVRQKGHYGVVSIGGQVVIPITYSRVFVIND